MKVYTVLVNLLILLLGLSTVHAGERGTWVVRFDIDSPEKVAQICSGENQAQFDRFLVQVRGRADSWYESSFVPKAEGLDDFDPLAAILAACTDVEIHAWLNVYYLWTGDIPPEDGRHPYYNDDWLLKDRTGRPLKEYSELEQRQRWLEGVYADPASPEYRDYFSRVVGELIGKYELAGIHLDFVRYPGSFFGSGGDGSQPTLTKITRQGLAAYANNSGDAASLSLLGERLAWEQERAHHVTSLVRDVKTTMDKIKPDLKLSASVFPDVVEAFLDKGQNWLEWLKEDLLDELYVMAYFGDGSRVQSQISQCKTICDRYQVKMWAGLGAYIKSAKEIRQEIAQAQQVGVTDICLFSLGHLLKQGKDVAQYQPLHPAEVQLQPRPAELPPLVSRIVADDFEVRPGQQPAAVTESEMAIRLRGIFRYVDQHDDYAKVQDQYEMMQQIQAELQAGQVFAKVSRQYSQAGTKRYGGLLPDLHYKEAKTPAMQHLFSLKPGDYSGVIPVHNGFWLFQLL